MKLFFNDANINPVKPVGEGRLAQSILHYLMMMVMVFSVSVFLSHPCVGSAPLVSILMD